MEPTYYHIVGVLQCTDECDGEEIFQIFLHHLVLCIIVTTKTLPVYSQQKVAILRISIKNTFYFTYSQIKIRQRRIVNVHNDYRTR